MPRIRRSWRISSRSAWRTKAREIPYFTDEPKYPSYFHPTPSSGPYRNSGPYGLSLALANDSARLKALAEFYERLCLHHAPYDPEPSPRNEGDADPAAFAPRERLSVTGIHDDSDWIERLRQARYRWISAVSLSDGRTTRVPARVVLPNFDRGDEPVIIPKIGSSGAALGRRGDGGAAARGLFETIERHTARGFRIESVTAQRIVGFPDGPAQIAENLRRYRLEPYVFRLASEFGVPCVAAALADRSGVGSALSLAMRAAPTWERAIEDVLLEALERRRPARLERSRGEPAYPVYPWSTLERLERARPAIDAAPTIRFSNLDDAEVTADDLLGRLRENGLDVLQVDLTLPEVAAAGFEAVKILIPQLGPMPA